VRPGERTTDPGGGGRPIVRRFESDSDLDRAPTSTEPVDLSRPDPSGADGPEVVREDERYDDHRDRRAAPTTPLRVHGTAPSDGIRRNDQRVDAVLDRTAERVLEGNDRPPGG
jgi:hypothetical protein